MGKKQRDFKFDKRASSYDAGFEGKLSQRFYEALLSQVELKEGYTVLDVGCGTGHFLSKMSQVQEINGYGIDVEPEMIDIAKARCPGMAIQVSACEKTSFENGTFDVLTACMAYHHFSDKAGFAKEASRILKNGGCLYIADPRFPFPLRKVINGTLKLMRISGKFFTAKEISEDFGRFSFEFENAYDNGIVQVVKLRKVL